MDKKGIPVMRHWIFQWFPFFFPFYFFAIMLDSANPDKKIKIVLIFLLEDAKDLEALC